MAKFLKEVNVKPGAEGEKKWPSKETLESVQDNAEVKRQSWTSLSMV